MQNLKGDKVEYCLVRGAVVVLALIGIAKLIGAELGSLFH
jgi:hypothetical protein